MSKWKKNKQLDTYLVNDVEQGFSYWRDVLTMKCIGMFKYSGLPDSLPANMIESNLILNGYSSIFNHNKYGIVTINYGGIGKNGGLSDYDCYNRPTRFVYANPVLGSGNLRVYPAYEFTNQKIMKDNKCVVIYNSFIDCQNTGSRGGLREVIFRYARMLADIEASISICTVNTRLTALLTAQTQQTAESIKRAFREVEKGVFSVISVNNIMETINPLIPSTGPNSDLNDLLNARDKILSCFLQEIAVNFHPEKRERLITAETESSNQLLLINIDDMLEQRKIGVEECNKYLGTNISVELNKNYDPTSFAVSNTNPEKGEKDNEDTRIPQQSDNNG